MVNAFVNAQYLCTSFLFATFYDPILLSRIKIEFVLEEVKPSKRYCEESKFNIVNS